MVATRVVRDQSSWSPNKSKAVCVCVASQILIIKKNRTSEVYK